MKTEVHQFLPSLGFRDAVGNHTIETKRALRRAGFSGEIWAEEIHPQMRGAARIHTDYPGSKRKPKQRLLLMQSSTGSQGLLHFFLKEPGNKTFYYHNITPPEFFEPFDPGAAISLARGREELRILSENVSLAAAASNFNKQELLELGLSNVTVIPPYLNPGLSSGPHRSQTDWIRKSKKGLDLLFVGRVVPNKGHHRLLRVLAAMKAGVDPGARLFVVGAWGPEPYMRSLFHLRSRLALEEGVAFTGSVSEAALVSYYSEADAFVSMSEHDGFGLPLIEAMRFDVPVVAYDAGAVSETLGGSGILVREPDPALVAEAIGFLLSDSTMREGIQQKQRERVREVEAIPRDLKHVELVKELVGDR